MEIWNTPLLMIDFKKEIASQHKREGTAENMGTVGTLLFYQIEP